MGFVYVKGFTESLEIYTTLSFVTCVSAWPLIECLHGLLVVSTGFSVSALCVNCYVLQYATVEKDGEKYLTYKNFVCDYLKLVDQETNSGTIDLIAKIADTTKDR